jgi:hypothetical protein
VDPESTDPESKELHPMIEEDKTVAPPPENQRIPCEEEKLDAADAAGEKIHIPDYVMQDFGFPEKTRTGS